MSRSRTRQIVPSVDAVPDTLKSERRAMRDDVCEASPRNGRESTRVLRLVRCGRSPQGEPSRAPGPKSRELHAQNVAGDASTACWAERRGGGWRGNNAHASPRRSGASTEVWAERRGGGWRGGTLRLAQGALSSAEAQDSNLRPPAWKARRRIGYGKAVIKGPFLAGCLGGSWPNQVVSPPSQVLRDNRSASLMVWLPTRDRLRFPAPAVRSYNAWRW